MMKIVNEPSWDNDLIQCPSQCYCFFEDMNGRRMCIYLRWRWDDPWTAQLVPVTKEGEFLNGPWQYLDVPDFVHDAYRNLQRICVEIIDRELGSVRWLERDISIIRKAYGY